mmetsp:Transcript_14745/g.10646  ORF Transcript_14745/g.10646 Transcript_14745/m.10646 type:complete len:224 (+) Transcript_14745:1231-1902(+)
MIEDENKEETKVEFRVYKEYFEYLGKWKFVATTQGSLILFSIFKILSDYWVGSWAYSPEQQARFAYYAGLSFLFATICSVFVFTRTAAFLFSSLEASKKLHEDMIFRIFRAPINLYFDVTPIGRILNKFSKDLNAVETQLGYTAGSLFALFYLSLSALLVSICAVYWVAFLVPVVVYCSVWIYRRVIGAYRETMRVQSVTKSPLLSLLAEAGVGSTTIRAFKK